MSNGIRIKIGIREGLLEIEGDEIFIEKILPDVKNILNMMPLPGEITDIGDMEHQRETGDRLHKVDSGTVAAIHEQITEKSSTVTPSRERKGSGKGVRRKAGTIGSQISGKNRSVSTGTFPVIPGAFTDWIGAFPDTMDDENRFLVSAFFLQKKSKVEVFNELDVCSLLNETMEKQGVPLLIARNAVIESLKKKEFVITVKKTDKVHLLRVTPAGETHILQLLER